MPKIVDHEAQRAKFAEAVIRLVARDGFEGLTMRAVAAEAGLSYGSLFHYFDSKDELLMHAVQYSTSRQTIRANEYSNRWGGLKALEHLLCDDALIDPSTRDDAVVWLAFMYKAAREKAFARMHTELIDGWVARIRQLLREASEAGELDPGLDLDGEALSAWAFSLGLGQQALLHPKTLPPARQKQLISKYLDKLR
ncbi:MAG: TetR family transcriptional regulator C-terminal domain-containing protein [Lysobacterales bacterium]|jgi:AcrR family transcriptional regulator